MPFVRREGTRLFWREDGVRDGRPLILLNSIASDMSLWDPVVTGLASHFRLVRMDFRGHGRSDPGVGEYDLALLGADVVAVMDTAAIPRAAIAGVSLGGMVALEIALDHPERVETVITICTGISFDSALWDARIAAVRTSGLDAIVDGVMQRFLSPVFQAASPSASANVRQRVLETTVAGYAGAAAAIRDMDLADRLGSVTASTLVISGSDDVAAPAADHGDIIAAAISGARQRMVSGAHLAHVENPAGIAAELKEFLSPPARGLR